MNKIIAALFLMISLAACNKEVESVPVPPFSVFPNPFTDVFTIYFDASANAFSTVRVYDGAENEILKFTEIAVGTGSSVDMSSQEKGIYYVEMTTDGKTYIQSILKAE